MDLGPQIQVQPTYRPNILILNNMSNTKSILTSKMKYGIKRHVMITLYNDIKIKRFMHLKQLNFTICCSLQSLNKITICSHQSNSLSMKSNIIAPPRYSIKDIPKLDVPISTFFLQIKDKVINQSNMMKVV